MFASYQDHLDVLVLSFYVVLNQLISSFVSPFVRMMKQHHFRSEYFTHRLIHTQKIYKKDTTQEFYYSPDL